MSSVVGHSLLGIVVYACCPLSKHGLLSVSVPFSPRSLAGIWLLCLVVVAVAPDLDYVVSWLDMGHYGGLRVSHSLMFSLWIPGAVTFGLWRAGIGGKSLTVMTMQMVVAGLSHLVLDLLVGVSPVPALWPLSQSPWKLPFGVLPSAGRLQWGNYYLYLNLKIEMGVLLPLSCCAVALFWWHRQSANCWAQSWAGRLWIWSGCSVGLVIAAYFAHQAYLLPR
ncbi:MAG: metal-dependent hydrolase [Cyanobacteria bacterium P01_G01_bin.4]